MQLYRSVRSIRTVCNKATVGYHYLLMASVLALVSGSISVGIGVVLYVGFHNFRPGSWWSGMLVALVGFNGILAHRRLGAAVLCIVAVVSTVVAAVGLVVDALSLEFVSSIEACINKDYQSFGKAMYIKAATDCYYSDYTITADCYCAASSNRCYVFDGDPNCESIFETYSPLLKAVVAFDSLNLAILTVITVLACLAVCCGVQYHDWLYPPPSPEPSSAESFADLQGSDEDDISDDGLQIQMAVNLEKSRSFHYFVTN